MNIELDTQQVIFSEKSYLIRFVGVLRELQRAFWTSMFCCGYRKLYVHYIVRLLCGMCESQKILFIVYGM